MEHFLHVGTHVTAEKKLNNVGTIGTHVTLGYGIHIPGLPTTVDELSLTALLESLAVAAWPRPGPSRVGALTVR